jgi:formylglycine-generating enzyme required for sulfatase activity
MFSPHCEPVVHAVADIFISYKSEERALPEALAADLRAAGYTVWWDMELVGGPAFRPQILARLEAARAVIVIWTPSSVLSDFVLDEAGRAKRVGKLIPVRVPELTAHELPLGYGQAQTYLLAERHRIIGALTALGVRPGAAAPATVSPANGADAKLWAEVCKSGGIEDYAFYLLRFPKGLHSAEADERIWRICEADDTAAGCKRYLDLLPESEHHGVAAYRLERRQALEEQQRRSAEEKRLQEKQRRQEAEYKARGLVPVETWTPQGSERRWIAPGGGRDQRHVFRDFQHGPEMVVVPAGEFMMGSPPDEEGRFDDEGPRHGVTITKPFAIGRFPVTRGEFAAFVKATNHWTDGGAYVLTGSEWKFDPSKSWRNPGFAQDDSHPVVCVNWEDARAYIAWLNSVLEKDLYRLPSEAEWEYCCRAGTKTPFWWGASISTEQANYDGRYGRTTLPVKSFEPNPWGLYQVHGNVWEWCADDERTYSAASVADPAGALDGPRRALRGGSWDGDPVRAAGRLALDRGYRSSRVGFRCARVL